MREQNAAAAERARAEAEERREEAEERREASEARRFRLWLSTPATHILSPPWPPI